MLELQNASPSDLRQITSGAVLTGARPGELRRTKARDFDPHSKTLLIPESKSYKAR